MGVIGQNVGSEPDISSMLTISRVRSSNSLRAIWTSTNLLVLKRLFHYWATIGHLVDDAGNGVHL